jgi:peptidyl-prolyl cis-trans isomerase C
MPSKKTDESPDANLVLVEVNGQTLSSSQLDDLVEAQMAQQGASLKPDQVADAIRHFRAHAIRDFITQVLLEDEAAARKLEVPAGEVEKAKADMARHLPPGASLEEALASAGMSVKDFNARLEKELRVRNMVNGELAKVPPVTEAETEAFYNKESADLSAPETVSARHILVMSDEKDSAQVKAEKRAKIESLSGELRAGADFATLAKKHSECPSGQEGGALGSFRRGQMVKPFEDAAFSQPLNVVGPVVETPFGFHLIEVTEREDGSIKTYEEVKDQIREHLGQRKKQAAFMEFINSLQAKATMRMDPSIETEIEEAEDGAE